MGKKVRRGKPVRYVEPLVPLPNTYRVVYDDQIDLGDGQQVGGYTVPSTGEIHVSSRDRFNTTHEIGHVLDTQNLTDAERARFQRIMHLRGPWQTGTGEQAGQRSPSEVFADTYAWAALNVDPRSQYVGAYGTQPTVRQLRKVRKLLARVTNENNLRLYGSDGVTKTAQPGGYRP